jgi:membrane-anchored mycosin MYCP
MRVDVDEGRDNGHPLLQGRILSGHGDPQNGASGSDHASEVASVIAARRGVDTVYGMAGCCSARLSLFNVLSADGTFDSAAYYDALSKVGDDRLSVVNISLGSEAPDPIAEQLIKEAVARGVVFVAAVANHFSQGNPKMFPAGYDDVIGVGATDFTDQKLDSSCTGDHVFISAPGWRILAVYGDSECRVQSGTSFAAAFVSAAVWLTKRKHATWDTETIKGVLKTSVDGVTVTSGARDASFGYGRLDVARLATQL